MKETLTGVDASTAFTCIDNTDIKISGDFVGLVWVESQTPGETTWEQEPNSQFQSKTSFTLNVNDSTIAYRIACRLQSGAAIVYAGGVTEVV